MGILIFKKLFLVKVFGNFNKFAKVASRVHIGPWKSGDQKNVPRGSMKVPQESTTGPEGPYWTLQGPIWTLLGVLEIPLYTFGKVNIRARSTRCPMLDRDFMTFV